jgi:NRPS condensation-like uncharacterized protein
MIIQVELRFSDPLEEDVLRRAADLLLDAEPVLGCRLVLDAPVSYWQPVAAADRRVLTVTAVAADYEQIRCSGLRATDGVQVALCLCRADRGDRLLVKMSHEAGDGMGLRLLTARLSDIYTKLCGDPAFVPERNVDGSRDFGQVLARVSTGEYPRIMWTFARFLAPRCFPRRTHTLPLPEAGTGPWTPIVRTVPAPHLSAVAAYAKARGSTLNDMFLAVAYRALAAQGAWDTRSGLRIAITLDLRRWYLHDRPRAVGNLSSFDCPFLGRHLGRDLDETLAKVTALMRQRKRNWPGLAAALIGYHLTKGRTHAALASADARRVRRTKLRLRRSLTLSNEGALDGDPLRFGGQVPIAAHILPPFIKVPGVHLCVSSYQGALTLAAVTSANGAGVVADFLDMMLAGLRAVAPGGPARNGAGRRDALSRHLHAAAES